MTGDEKEANQVFHTSEMSKGCTRVVFRNHTPRQIVGADVEHLVSRAHTLFGSIPWQTLKMLGRRLALQHVVWVDIADHYFDVGVVLSEDKTGRTRIRHRRQEWKEAGKVCVQQVCGVLHDFAAEWRAKPDNRHDLSEQLADPV